LERIPDSDLHSDALIDTDAYAKILRDRSIKGNDTFLITNFKGSIQEGDISEGYNCQGFGRVHHFRDHKSAHWVTNPLPHQVAAWKLGLPVQATERAQVFQNASCNWRCWYCFVDFSLLSASTKHSEFKTSDELLELFLKETNRPKLIDLSGGQPDIIPEWPVRMMEAMRRRSLQDEYFLWMDDNLSVYYPWELLNDSEFALMKTYRNFGRVGCFKGFSGDSFRENTRARPEILSRQIDIMSRWVKLGVDTYGYITLTTSSLNGMRNSLREFMNSIQDKVGHSFLLRTIPLEIFRFSPTVSRMKAIQERALENQNAVLAAWVDELDDRFSREERSTPIYEVPLTH